MWVGIAPLQCTIECRSGRMHRRHAPLTLMAKNTRNRGFRSISRIVLDGSSPNLACGLVLPPYCALLNAVSVGCTDVTHHWLWWLKTLELQVSRPFLTELLMDHHQTWHVCWYCPPTLNAVTVGCTGVTHHWLWWLKTLETQVSRPFLTELLMDHNQTWHVGWYYHPTDPYLLPLRSNAHVMCEWVWAISSSS